MRKLAHSQKYPFELSGFTIIELLAVLAVIGILTTIVVGGYRQTQRRGRDAQRKSDLKQMSQSLEVYLSDHGTYPPSSVDGRIMGCPAETTECDWGSGQFSDSTGNIYFVNLPDDPSSSQDYFYRAFDSNRKYQIFARFENPKDQNCLGGNCNPDPSNLPSGVSCSSSEVCNYAVYSPNVRLAETFAAPTPTPTFTPTPTPTLTPTPTSTPTPSATLTPTPTPTSGPAVIAHEETITGTATGNPSSVSTSGSVTASSGVYLAVVVSKSNVSVSSVSGLGVSWSEIANQCSGRNQQGLSVWKAALTPSSSGIVTATFSSAPSEAAISVSRYSGATTTGNIAKANTNGVNGGCSGGTDSSSPAVNLTTTASNSFAFGAAAKRNRTFTPGSGFAERADFNSGGGGSAAGIAIEDKAIASPSTFPVNGTLSSATDWAIVAVEIK